MFISKTERRILNSCIKNKPDLQQRFYTVEKVASRINGLSYEDILDFCFVLADKKLISWGR